MPLKDDLHKLAKLSRNKKNLEKITDQLSELRDAADQAEGALNAVQAAREALTELADNLDADDNPLLPWAAELRDAAVIFTEVLPPEEADELDDLISEAEGNTERYEESLEDKDCTADDREEIWGELLDSLENIAEALQ
jgi:flagellar biosynthesis regulator FlaF